MVADVLSFSKTEDNGVISDKKLLVVLLLLPEEDRNELRDTCIGQFSNGHDVEDVLCNLHRKILQKCAERDIPLKGICNKTFLAQVQEFVAENSEESHLHRGYN